MLLIDLSLSVKVVHLPLMTRILNKLYSQLKKSLSNYDRLYLSIVRLRYRGVSSIGIVSESTDIVIEGFPRSANTYMLNAFKICQEVDFNIAHHLHATPQVTYAIKENIPVILLIRRPIDCVVSVMIRNPSMSANDALREYIHFYSFLKPYITNVTLAFFDDVISDSNKIIQRVNSTYNTKFRLGDNKPKDEQIFSLIEEQNLKNIENINRKYNRENLVARPSIDRLIKKDALSKQFDREPLQRLLFEADSLYSFYKASIE